LREPIDPARVDAPKIAPGNSAEAILAVSNLQAGPAPPRIDPNLCSALPDEALRDALGAFAAHNLEGLGCRYTGTAGQLEIAAFPPDSYYSREYDTLSAEGMGSLQVRAPDDSIAIVHDRERPVLAYLHKDKMTYSVNLDRQNPPPTSEEYVRLADLLNAGLPPSTYTAAN
jgi:hypothetical protein